MKIFHRTKQSFLARQFKYQPLVQVLVFKNRLLNNLQAYQKAYPYLQFAPVLKSNAYGHGLEGVAEILEKQNLPFLIVDSYFEVLRLRRQGIKSKILVVGFSPFEYIARQPFKNVSFTLTSLEILKELAKNLRKIKSVHIKIDTGMHRQGILSTEVNESIQLIQSNPNIILEGICSHLAYADGADSSFTEGQIGQWNKLVETFKSKFSGLKYWHLSATAGTRFAAKIKANVVRLGIGFYGFDAPQGETLKLLPALEMKTIVSSIKSLKAGEKVGYNITYTAPQDMKIAALPVGYYEGVDRRLSNAGVVKIKGIFCPIVGRVSMNITTVDVSRVPDVAVGDEAVVISASVGDPNSVQHIATACQTIPYEILVHIPQPLRRVYE